MNNNVRNHPQKVFMQTVVCFVGILLSGLLLRNLFYVGLVFDSSVLVATNSWELFASPAPFEGIGEIYREIRLLDPDQILLIFPTGIAFNLLGVGDMAVVIFPILSALLTAISVFFLGKAWHRVSVGLLAMFIWFLLPTNLFLSANLIEVAPVIFINIFAVAVYIYGKQKKAPVLSALSGVFLVPALFLNWEYFAASAVFILVDLGRNIRHPKKGFFLSAVIAGTLLYLFLNPEIGPLTLNLYYQIRFVVENLYVFPLLVLALVFAHSNKADDRPTEIINWLAAKVAVIIFGAKWITVDSLTSEIGMSGFWLDVLVPGSLLIAWMIVERLEKKQGITKTISFASFSMVILALVLLGRGSLPGSILTASRIGLGLSLVGFLIVLLTWSSSKGYRGFAFFFLLITFLLGNFSITNDYWSSYRFPIDDANEIFSSFVPGDDITLFVGGKNLFARINYMTGFPETQIEYKNLELIVANLDQSNPNTLPSGAHVVITEEYGIVSLGLIPAMWELQEFINNSEIQSLLLYEVRQ